MEMLAEDPEVRAGREIARRRAERGWSQVETARRYNARFGDEMNQTMVSKIELAQRPLRLREAANFAGLFEITVQDLLQSEAPARSIEELQAELATLLGNLPGARNRVEHARGAVRNAQSGLLVAREEFREAETKLMLHQSRLDHLMSVSRSS